MDRFQSFRVEQIVVGESIASEATLVDTVTAKLDPELARRTLVSCSLSNTLTIGSALYDMRLAPQRQTASE